jgi:glycosyltransferase involved in cell wall biosynthesis
VFDLAHLNITFLAGTLGLGGAERQLFYNVKALRESGATVRVLSLTRGEYWEHRLTEIGASVQWIGQSPSRVNRLAALVARLRRDRPVLLQSQHFFTNLYAAAAARVLGLREIGAIRNDAYSEIDFTGRLGSWCLRAPRMLAANSARGMQNAIALGVPARRVRMLPNVIDTDQFRPGPSLNRDGVHLLTVGMRQEKRIDRFLRLVDALRSRSGLPLRATIVGDGAERPKYEQLAGELGLLPHIVSFTGSMATTAELYQSADVFVLTSDFEGTPNVLLEAMASGLPVVAYRTGGIPEVVRHDDTGFIGDFDDEEGLAPHVQRLIDSPHLRAQMGKRARAWVERNYALDRLPGILARFYGEAVA